MLSKLFFVSALFALGALGAALPNPTPNSISICAERGIDIHGPIPSDATPFHGGYTFDADSDTSHWIRARTDTALSKREYAGIAVTMWTFPGCTGPGAYFPSVQYDHQNVAPAQYSYAAVETHRALLLNERLDFSQRTPQMPEDFCYRYMFSAPREMSEGCLDVDAVSCFRLWRT